MICLVWINGVKRIQYGLILFTIALFFMSTPGIHAQPLEEFDSPPVKITEGWQYRWGDSPVDEAGVPFWTYQELDSPDWKSTKATARLPGHEGRRILWLRARLPEGKWEAPTVLIPRVYLLCHVYLDRSLIYSSGDFKPDFANRFSSFIPVRFSLPGDFQGKTLFIRTYTDSPGYHGLERPVLVGTSESLLVWTIHRGLIYLILGGFFIFIGLFSLTTLFERGAHKTYAALGFGLFTTFIGLAFIASHPATLLLVQAPKFWFYSLFVSFFIFPIGLILFVDQVIGAGYKSIIRRLWQIHVVIAVVALVLEVLKIMSLPRWYFFLQYLWIVAMIVVVATSIHPSIKGSFEARIFTAGVAFFSLFAVHDILRGSEFALMHWGTFGFVLLLGYLLLHRFSENRIRLQIYSKELEEKTRKLEAAKVQLEEYSQTLEQKVEERTREVQEKQAQLVQSSKMASLGSLVAGVAHEINTPVGAINSMHSTLMKAVENLKMELEERLKETHKEYKKIDESLKIVEDANKVIQAGTDRVVDIVRRLRSFARLDEAELKDADIHEGLEDTLTIVHHELKHNITVIRNYGEVPKISCFPGRLNQVFLNILINAKQAIKGKGEITISTYTRDNKAYIEIRDSGEGIPEENLSKIFDPGFTTRGVGVGTGLGLSICYQIIQDHQGEILVKSEVGKGTTFTVVLPMDLEKRINPDSNKL